MKCPYCNTSIHEEWIEKVFVNEKSSGFDRNDDFFEGYSFDYLFCPECENLIIKLRYSKYGCELDDYDKFYMLYPNDEEIIYPKFPSSIPLNDAIPEKYRKIYQESEQVNNISPRASATLSRYLLQMILHEELKILKRNLDEELKELEKLNNIPSKLVAMLQVMRRIANFGAHPKKSTNSNEIVEVEEGESNVMLDLLNELFDYVFIKPKQQEEFLKNAEEKYGIKL